MTVKPKSIAAGGGIVYRRRGDVNWEDVMRLLLLLGLGVAAACSSGPNNRFTEHQKKNTPPPPKEAPKKVVKKEVDYHGLVAEGAILVDVRTPKEFARGSVPGAKNVPYEELLQRLDALGRMTNRSSSCSPVGAELR